MQIFLTTDDLRFYYSLLDYQAGEGPTYSVPIRRNRLSLAPASSRMWRISSWRSREQGARGKRWTPLHHFRRNLAAAFQSSTFASLMRFCSQPFGSICTPAGFALERNGVSLRGYAPACGMETWAMGGQGICHWWYHGRLYNNNTLM